MDTITTLQHEHLTMEGELLIQCVTKVFGQSATKLKVIQPSQIKLKRRTTVITIFASSLLCLLLDLFIFCLNKREYNEVYQPNFTSLIHSTFVESEN